MKRIHYIIIALLCSTIVLQAQAPELQHRFRVLGVKGAKLVIPRPPDRLLSDSIAIKIIRPVSGGEVLLAAAKIDTITRRFCRLIVPDTLEVVFWIGDWAVFETPGLLRGDSVVAAPAESDSARISGEFPAVQPPFPEQDSLLALLEALDSAPSRSPAAPAFEEPAAIPEPILGRFVAGHPEIQLAVFTGYGYARPAFWVDYQRSLVRKHNGYTPVGLALWYGPQHYQAGVEVSMSIRAMDFTLSDYFSGDDLWEEAVSTRRYGLVGRWVNRLGGYRAYARLGVALYRGSYRITFKERFFQDAPQLSGSIPAEDQVDFKTALGMNIGFGVTRRGSFLEVVYHLVNQSLAEALPGGVVVERIRFDHFAFRVGYQISLF